MFLAGRTREPLEAVAADVAAAGGKAEVAVLDATDETAVDAHADAVAARAGSIDVSFNLITRGDSQGTPLKDMALEQFLGALRTGAATTFLTARAAARHMVQQRSGVILHLTSGSARGAAPMMGNTGPADAATDTLIRYLAAELGPYGVRAVGIHTAGVLGTLSAEKVAAVTGEADPQVEQMMAMLTGMTMLKRRPELDQIAATAAFLASDGAGAITSGMRERELRADRGMMAAEVPTTEAEFAQRTERHRRELHVHCYRMVGNFEEAEDLVQETLLRAWRARERLERDEWFRAWLYKIATNACLDAIKRDGRRVPSLGSFRDVPWLQPYPDRLLDEIAPPADEPDATVVSRETIELTFLAVIQLLPPRQRAVLVLREVLDWPASEVADLLEISEAAVNSALQRARATLRQHLPPDQREDWAAPRRSERDRARAARRLHRRARARATPMARWR